MTIKVTVAPKGMGLNDFVAMREGFFATEGLDVEFDMKTFRGTQGNWKDLDYFNRPQDRPFSENRSVIQGACAWGSICNASSTWENSSPIATASRRGEFTSGRFWKSGRPTA